MEILIQKQIHVLKKIVICIIVFWGHAFLDSSLLVAMPIGEGIRTVADRLQANQVKEGVYVGSWPGEIDFTGSIILGITNASDIFCDRNYKSSAELGGNVILVISEGNFYGDEVLALTCLDLNSTDPNNPWQDAISDFYYYHIKNIYGSTLNYIRSYFYSIDPSLAVFYMANYAIAADYIDANDKHIWREELISLLSHVDDSSMYPVMALGSAVWALIQTGPLDETVVESSVGQDVLYWKSRQIQLSELPDLLLSHQVQDGQLNAGSFYWQFGHTQDSLSGYTEDTIFATLGLVEIYKVNPDPNIYSAMLNAREALLGGISSEGIVSERLSQEGEIFYVYSGEMLQVLSALIIPGDVNLDGIIDSSDTEIIYSNWGEQCDCMLNSWCGGADIDRNGTVDVRDLNILLDNWLKQTEFGGE